ncbi:hypothetical protein [Saccharomonospora viridis]|uniref:PE family protein n=1 Tax=Saccharomonospora viridis (strain ATCC 15386 / DSM 43017 / JCM 3036 / CCUG 5913 / NBRC 12207 / NCIMB 9602 / P101) TaxID=471857 RepID=C7MQI0_SACVD|nr:hypothetical protein [Saccharomonospora viridis]ACU98507.1 hypothetical protein Svir_35510 [Saccharomonospora viridis DSM 43017]
MTASGNWLSDVMFWVDGVASGAAGGGAAAGGGGALGGSGGGAPSGSQGFSLTREEAERALEEFRAIHDDLVELEYDARRLLELRPPAGDPASVRLNEAFAGGSSGPGVFGYGAGHVKKEIAYFSELVERLEKALGYVAEADESAGHQVGQVGGIETGESKGHYE